MRPVFAVLFALFACAQTEPVSKPGEAMIQVPAANLEPPTDDDLKTVSDAFILAVKKGDTFTWTALYDSEQTVRLAANEGTLPTALVEQSIAESQAQEAEILKSYADIVSSGGSIRALTVHEEHGGRWIGLGVVYPTGAFDQIRLRVAATDDGPRVVDVWGLTVGLSVSDQLRNSVTAVLGSDQPDNRAALASRVELAAKMGHSHPKYVAELQAFVEAYPDDSTSMVHQLELASIAGDHAKVAQVAERLHGRFGPDAYLLVIASSAYAQAGDLDESSRVAGLAVSEEPGLLAAQMQRLKIGAERGDEAVVSVTLEVLSDDFGVTPAVFPQSAVWRALRGMTAFEALGCEDVVL